MRTLLLFLVSAFACLAQSFNVVDPYKFVVNDWILLSARGSTNDTTARRNYNVLDGNSDVYTSNTLYWVVVTSSPSNATCTVTGAQMTWNLLNRTNYNTIGTPASVVTTFAGMTNNVTSGRIAALFNETQTACNVAVMGVFNVDSASGDGFSAFVQTNGWGQNAGANFSNNIPTAIAPTATNAVLAVFGTDVNPAAGTVESGWTEFFDTGVSSPATGIYVTGRVGTTDASVAPTAASCDWGSLAYEIRPRQVSVEQYPVPSILWWPVVCGGGPTEPAKVGPNLAHDIAYAASKFGTGYALSLNGTSHDGQSATTMTYGVKTITITCWVNFNVAWSSARILCESSANSNTNPDAFRWYYDIVTSTNTIALAIQGDNPGKRILFPPPSDSANHHLAAIFDNSTLTGNVKLYVDGVEKTGLVNNTGSTKTTTNNFAVNTLFLGSRNRGTEYFWGGKIEEFQVHTNELSSTAINQLYNRARK